MKKTVLVHPAAVNEMKILPKAVQIAIKGLVNVLEQDGYLSFPDGRKISGHSNLFEMRIRLNGQWRGFYGYVGTVVVIVHFTSKKRQKTDIRDIKLGLNRIKDYEQ